MADMSLQFEAFVALQVFCKCVYPIYNDIIVHSG